MVIFINQDKPKWTRKIQAIGNASGITLPKELLEFLQLKKGSEIHAIGDTGKHGKYIALWNPKQKAKK